MHTSTWSVIALALLASTPSLAAGPIVIELFTSQSCSSCPPADALLAEMSQTESDVLPLGLHVTYWDRLGWKDTYSLPVATERQNAYAGAFGSNQVYTPQMVVGGRHQAVGSDRRAVLAALAAARADARENAGPELELRREGGRIRLEAGSGAASGRFWLVGFDPARTTAVRGGENGGRTLTDVNVVRSMRRVGDWAGAAMTLMLEPPAGERVAVLLQDGAGRILSAATLR